jgi:hypothetical protein
MLEVRGGRMKRIIILVGMLMALNLLTFSQEVIYSGNFVLTPSEYTELISSMEEDWEGDSIVKIDKLSKKEKTIVEGFLETLILDYEIWEGTYFLFLKILIFTKVLAHDRVVQ